MCTAASSRLGQHCILAPSAGLHVSPLQLGGSTNVGRATGNALDKDGAFGLLDAFYTAGGNVIDTSHDDQGGLSEEWIGEWAEQRGVRDQLVIATKCGIANPKDNDSQNTHTSENLNVKVIVLSLEQSLKKLRTSYVDILYVDSWEPGSTPVEEVMNGLHHLVEARKVFYLGLSNSPAWICSKANMYARAHGKTPFVIYQGSWDVMDHTFKRDVVPVALAEGMALALRNIAPADEFGSAEDNPQYSGGGKRPFGQEMKMKAVLVLEKVAKEVGTEDILAVAVAYLLHTIPYAFPIIGGSTVEELAASTKGLEITLLAEQISRIDSAIASPIWISPSVNEQMDASAPEPVDARAIAHAWLKDFRDATASGNAQNFATKLLQPDGWLRDLLVFSWDNRTLHGHDKIIGYLETSLASAHITNVALDETPALHPSPFVLPFGRGIELSFRFETPIAHGRGFARLLPESSPGMKALSVFVMMDDLKGHEESGAETGLYGGHTITWDEVLKERRTEVETNPQVVIVGGGHSGLQVAARLKQMNIKALVVEQNKRIGDNWRRRYPSLTLHTARMSNSTLYHPFPSNFPQFIPRDKIADWLEHYAVAQDLFTWTNTRVLPMATYDSRERRWTLHIDRDGTMLTLQPKHIIVACGAHGLPRLPSLPHAERFRGPILHSTQFTGGQPFTGHRIIVVGAGNSSADICQELIFRGAASVTMVQRSHTCVVSSTEANRLLCRVFPDDVPIGVSDFKNAAMPLGMVRAMGPTTINHIRAVDADMLEGLRQAGFRHEYRDGLSPATLFVARGGSYWLDVGCAKLIASGTVVVQQGVEPVSFTETSVVFNDGSQLQADAVIFATGYTTWKDRMKEIFDSSIVDATKDMWGLDEEDEMRGAYRPTGHPGFWFAVGGFSHSRFYSKQLALHIKADELGLKDN